MTYAERRLTQLAEQSGITINGNNPWDIQVHDPAVYSRIFASGRLALGESFMAGQWECDDLVEACSRLLKSGAADELRSLSTLLLSIKSRLFNLQSSKRAFEVGEVHYDYGNEMYEAMLGESMVYTCANFRGLSHEELNAAQLQKLDDICQKLKLKKGKRLLDVGCGWGSLMKHAAKHYGVECVGISVSQEQSSWARESFGDLPCRIEIVDYREFSDTEGFDYITSIEMIEAVGQKNFRTFFESLHALLKPEGQVLLQAIVSDNHRGGADPWIDKYIFPNGTLPSHHELYEATRNLFTWQHLENIGPHYEHTLMAWWRNLETAYAQLHQLDSEKYNEQFLRMFKYYLHSCAALARTGNMHTWQLLLEPRKSTS